MRKTLVTFIITALILMTSITTVQGLSFSVKITPDKTTVQKGESVTLVISATNLDVGSKGINTILLAMEYDKNVFETVSKSDIEKVNNWDEPSFNPANGKILTTRGSFLNTDGEIVKIKLTAKTTATLGNTTVTFKNIEASNSESDIFAANTSYILNITEKTSDGGTNTPTDSQKPNVTVKYDTVDNGIKVTLTSDKTLKALAGWTLSSDKKQLSKIYTTNYTGTVVVEEENGSKSDAISIKVTGVTTSNGDKTDNTDKTDKTKPTASVKYTKGTNGVTVTVTASEEIQAVTGWTLSSDKKQLTRVFKENYNGALTIVDLAGNKSDAISIKVDTSLPNGGTDTTTNTNTNTNNKNNTNSSTTSTDKLPKAGLEAYIIPAIGFIAVIGTVAYVRYKSMEY